MTLVDDDEIEEVGVEIAKHAVEVRTAVRELLVQPEVDLTPALGLAAKLPDGEPSPDPKAGLYSRSNGWSTRTFRSAKYRMRGRRPECQVLFHSFQTICINANVFPVPVAMVSSSRFSPLRKASTDRLIAIRW